MLRIIYCRSNFIKYLPSRCIVRSIIQQKLKAKKIRYTFNSLSQYNFYNMNQLSSDCFNLMLNQGNSLYQCTPQISSLKDNSNDSAFSQNKSKVYQENRLNISKNEIDLKNIKIGKTIGTGSYGTVKVVQDSVKNELFALKIVSKNKILKTNQMEHIKNEKLILQKVSHPFIVKFYNSYSDKFFEYILLELIQGGQLFSQLKKENKFTNDITLFYISEIALALTYLHENDIIYRDLKPENIMIDKTGHIKLIDFTFSKIISNNRTSSICGTPEYLAPQIIKCSQQNGDSCKQYGKSADYWTLGILIFELLAGYPPFLGNQPIEIFQKIKKGIIEFPNFFSPTVKDLIRKLLNPNPNLRLGAKDNGASILKHRWFKTIDWQKIKQKQIQAPWIPKICSDFQNFFQCTEPLTQQNEVDL